MDTYRIELPFGTTTDIGNKFTIEETDIKDFAKRTFGIEKLSKEIDKATVEKVIEEMKKNGFTIKKLEVLGGPISDFKIRIDDQADEDDWNINGVVHFEIPYIKKLPQHIVECFYEIIKDLQERYHNILHDLDVEFCFLDVSFEDGWLDYSIEGKDEDEACMIWKKLQGVGGIPDNSP